MAKELPFFKFEPNEWSEGNIQICSKLSKGLFIDICATYWSRKGELSYALVLQKHCNGNTNELQELIDRIKMLYDEKGFANLVISEGTNISQNDPVYQKCIADNASDKLLKAMLTEEPEFDQHGNMKLGGTGIIIQRILAQGLDLSFCELAVLSACESNVGLVRAGQGIMSLQRALGIAGARGSITSLWKVDDLATQLLFTEFYRLLWEEKMPPAEALHCAKLWLRKLTLDEIKQCIADLPGGELRGVLPERTEPESLSAYHPYASPFFWASFVYWGKVEQKK